MKTSEIFVHPGNMDAGEMKLADATAEIRRLEAWLVAIRDAAAG